MMTLEEIEHTADQLEWTCAAAADLLAARQQFLNVTENPGEQSNAKDCIYGR